MTKDQVTLKDVEAASKRLAGVVHKTPLESSHIFSEMAGYEVLLKLENMQRTGSFKVRGASNCIQTLTKEQQAHGVIAASAGNHAQGVALGAQAAGIKATIVMPEGAPLAKVEATKGYGAEVVLKGNCRTGNDWPGDFRTMSGYTVNSCSYWRWRSFGGYCHSG